LSINVSDFDAAVAFYARLEAHHLLGSQIRDGA
jgi:hypothetical protein